MPFVNVKLTREGTEPNTGHVTAEQKAAIFDGIAQVLLDVLGKPKDWTWVAIDEYPLENWGWGGKPVAEYRRSLKPDKP